MRREPRQSFLALMLQLFGLEWVEQSLIDKRMAFRHRAQRMRLQANRALPAAAVSAVLALYAVGMVALTVRRLRSGSAAEEAEPINGEPPPERAETEVAEAVPVAV